MIEAKLEEKIASFVDALKLPHLRIIRTFEVADEGDVSGVGFAEDEAEFSITPENRAQNAWEIQQYDFAFNLQLSSYIGNDPTRANHLSRVEALTNLINGWCGRNGAENMARDFFVSGKFKPCFFQVGGGSNEIDREGGVYVWNQTITLRGYLN